MTTEDDFNRLLDKKPNDWQTRLIFADWLQDRGDPRAEGYRVLAWLKKRPLYEGGAPINSYKRKGPRPKKFKSSCWWFLPWKRAGNSTIPPHCHLPLPWLKKIKSVHVYISNFPYRMEDGGSKDFWSRQEAEDAAALAFSKLTKKQQLAIKELVK